MNKDIFQGKWNEVKGKVKEKWGNLTDDDLKKINGRREQLLGFLQQKYGYAKDRAEKEVKNFEDSFSEREEAEEEEERPRQKTGTEDF